MSERFVSVDRPARGKMKAGVETYRVTEDGWYEFATGSRMGWEKPGLRDATPEEIEAWRAKRAEVERRREEMDKCETALLALAGLTRKDFSRLRNVTRDGDVLHVETRENGMNTRSVGAIRNPNYVRSYTNEFDRTYEHYEFTIPQSDQ